MNINQFAKAVSGKEGKKEQVNIAQIKEILRVVNELTTGTFYAIIREGESAHPKYSRQDIEEVLFNDPLLGDADVHGILDRLEENRKSKIPKS